MDYHNVSCQTLMLHYSKDTLRYVKLFGALKSILRGRGVAVAGREAGGWQWHCCPAAESQPGASSRLETSGVSPHCAGTGAVTWQSWPWAAHTAPRTDLSAHGTEWDQSLGQSPHWTPRFPNENGSNGTTAPDPGAGSKGEPKAHPMELSWTRSSDRDPCQHRNTDKNDTSAMPQHWNVTCSLFRSKWTCISSIKQQNTKLTALQKCPLLL